SAGIIEPSCADAVREVSAHPQWLALPGRTVVVLGAGSEIGPLPVLLNWGVTVAGVDLAQPRIWDRVVRLARVGSGKLLVPGGKGGAAGQPEAGGQPKAGGKGKAAGQPEAAGKPQAADGGQDGLEQAAGADVTAEVPEIADWIAGLDGPLVLGNYVY